MPLVMPITLYGNSASQLGKASFALTFTIDKRGRAVTIRREPVLPVGLYYQFGDTSDLEASLAGSQFVPSAPQEACRVTYSPVITPIAEADDRLIARAISAPSAQMARSMVQQKLIEAGSTCLATNPEPRTIVYPDLSKRKVAPGKFDLFAYRFDIDAAGTPANITSILADGQSESDAEVRRALGASRFAPDARKGCISAGGGPSIEPLLLPERPPLKSFAVKSANCPFPATKLLRVASVPFPEAFRRRNIEGWAVIRFDVAPWGAVGNARVAAAEPAETFGREALQLVQRSKMDATSTGFSGCIATVRFATAAMSGVIAPGGRLRPTDETEIFPVVHD